MVDFNSLKIPKIEVVAELKGIEFPDFRSEEAAVFGAESCFSRKTSIELFKKTKEKHPESSEFEKHKKEVFQQTLDKGHLAVSDQAEFTINIQDAPRMFTLVLCQDQHREHLQQSLRRVDIEANDLYIPNSLKDTEHAKNFIELFNDNFKLYSNMTKAGIHREIARGVMPLYLTTAIQTKADGRAWWDLFNSSMKEEMPSAIQNLAKEIKNELSKYAPLLFKDRAQVQESLNYYPASQLFWPENKTLKAEIEKYNSLEKVILVESPQEEFMSEEAIRDAIENRNQAELANLKHIHFTLLWPISIYTWHQSTRQRTLEHTVESIYDAAKREAIITPSQIKTSEFIDEYNKNSQRGFELYKDAINNGIPKKEAIGMIPHNAVMFDKVHINGWNVVYMIGKRRCKEAQGEINNLARQSAEIIEEIYPALGRYAQPQGVIYGNCPEGKWDKCGYCKGIVSKIQRAG